MKQVNFFLVLLLISTVAHSQTVTPNPGPYQNISTKYQYTWQKWSGGLWNLGKLIQEDSAYFKGITYVPTALDADSNNKAANTEWVRKWVSENVSPGVPGVPVSSWATAGNYTPSDPTPYRLGLKDSMPLKIITNDQIRLVIPDNGIKRNYGLANKFLVIDTATKELYYMDAGGSSVTVTSYGKNATLDSTVLLLSDGTRYAAKDSVGSGGGSGSIDYVVPGFGVKVDSVDRTYTVSVDTSVIAKKDSIRLQQPLYVVGDTMKFNPDSSGLVKDIYKKAGTDSVFKKINGVDLFAYKDSSGAGGGGGVTNQNTMPATKYGYKYTVIPNKDIDNDSLANTGFAYNNHTHEFIISYFAGAKASKLWFYGRNSSNLLPYDSTITLNPVPDRQIDVSSFIKLIQGVAYDEEDSTYFIIGSQGIAQTDSTSKIIHINNAGALLDSITLTGMRFKPGMLAIKDSVLLIKANNKLDLYFLKKTNYSLLRTETTHTLNEGLAYDKNRDMIWVAGDNGVIKAYDYTTFSVDYEGVFKTIPNEVGNNNVEGMIIDPVDDRLCMVFDAYYHGRHNNGNVLWKFDLPRYVGGQQWRYVKRDGTTPLTGNWDAGNYSISTKSSLNNLKKDGIVLNNILQTTGTGQQRYTPSVKFYVPYWNGSANAIGGFDITAYSSGTTRDLNIFSVDQNKNLLSLKGGNGNVIVSDITFQSTTLLSASSMLLQTNGGGLTISNGTGSTVSGFGFRTGGAAINGNSTAYTFVRNSINWTQSSGSQPAYVIRLDGTATQSATGSGNLYGLYFDLNPTMTGGRYIAYENPRGDVYLNTTSGSTVVGSNGSPNASALLTVESTTKGFLPPRMTATQAEAIASPAEGLMIYSTDGSGTTITSKGWWGYDGSAWVRLN